MLSRRAGAACERISQWQLKEFKHLATTGRNWSEVLYIVLSKSAKVGPPSLHSLDASCFCVPEAVVSGQLYSRHPSFRLNKSSPRAASGRGRGQRERFRHFPLAESAVATMVRKILQIANALTPLREARWGEQQQVAFCLLAHGTEP